MNLSTQQNNRDKYEDFYKISLFKYKKEAIEKKKIERTMGKIEEELLINKYLAKHKKKNKVKDKINSYYGYLQEKTKFSKNNIAFKLVENRDVYFDGVNSNLSDDENENPGYLRRFGRAVKKKAKESSKKQLEYTAATVKAAKEYKKWRKSTKPLLETEEGKKLIGKISKISSKISLKELDDLSDTLTKVPILEAASLAHDIATLPDIIQKNEEGEAQLNLKKTKRMVKAGRVLGKYAKNAKKVRDAEKAAKLAKTAKTAANTAKAAKGLKTGLNIGKIISGFFSLETIGITLLITIAIWIFQLVCAHWFKKPWCPKLAGWEKIAMAACCILVAFIVIQPIAAFILPIAMVMNIPIISAAMQVATN